MLIIMVHTIILSEQQQQRANEIALEYLNKWLDKNGLEQTTLEDAAAVERQVDIY